MARARAHYLLGMVLAGSLSSAFALSGIANAQPAEIVVGPDQHFVADVNAKAQNSIIAVVCSAPLQPGQTGYPLAGQNVGVEPASGRHGYTGSLASSIVATFASGTVTFTEYGTQPIPSTLSLPCEGRGTVVFSPEPTSGTARSATVTTTYASVLTLTQSDSGNSYRLHKGGGLEIQLSGPSGVTWTEPVSSNPAVLQPTGGSSGSTATASFSAVAEGKAEVTATGTFSCSSVCAQPIVAFEVRASVG